MENFMFLLCNDLAFLFSFGVLNPENDCSFLFPSLTALERSEWDELFGL